VKNIYSGDLISLEMDGFYRRMQVSMSGKNFCCLYFQEGEYLNPGDKSEHLKAGDQINVYKLTLEFVKYFRSVEIPYKLGFRQDREESPQTVVSGRIEKIINADSCELSIDANCSIPILVEFEAAQSLSTGSIIEVEGVLSVELAKSASGSS